MATFVINVKWLTNTKMKVSFDIGKELDTVKRAGALECNIKQYVFLHSLLNAGRITSSHTVIMPSIAEVLESGKTKK